VTPGYQDDVGYAALKLLDYQDAEEGGWGLTTTSTPSIVNTAEALTVLRASGEPASDQIWRGVAYVAKNIPLHTRARPNGRGRNTRFVTFGIEGLTTYPEFLDEPEVRQSLNWAVAWLQDAHNDVVKQARSPGEGRAATPECWVESFGTIEPSLHQTSLVAANLARLVGEKSGDANWSAISDSARKMVKVACRALVRYRRHDGSFPSTLYEASASSPSKTALVAVALAYARDVIGDVELPWGYLDRPADKAQTILLSDAADSASQWLQSSVDRWKTYVEADFDVQGTFWVYLAYAQCLRGVAVGRSIDEAMVKQRLRYLSSLWDDDEARGQLWKEPTGGCTIRAAYHTVWAQEAFRRGQSLLHLPTPLPRKLEVRVKVRSRLVLHRHRSTAEIGEDGVEVALAGTQFAIVELLVVRARTSQEVAAHVGIALGSVAKTIERINSRIKALAASGSAPLIRSIAVSDARGTRSYFWTLSDSWAVAEG
jgi:hypothetical protein